MREPRFWQRSPDEPGILARLLTPVSMIYAGGTARRISQGNPLRLSVPVICIGNLNAGGTGKTPTTIALQMMLSARGIKAHVVSRGYGGSLEGPVQVDERSHSADQVGDEPLLLAAFGPTWVAKDRAAGGRAAVDAGAEVILLDDGFQNPALEKDLSIIVVDAAKGFGNGRVIPAGPLREPVATGLKRADFVLSIGPDDQQTSFAARWGKAIAVPHLTGQLKPLPTGMDWEGMRALAFAGIGHPEKFFATLKSLGADLAETHALDDHQPLTSALLTRLQADAKRLNAQLITTEKDAVRLPPDLRREVLSVPVRLEIDQPAVLEAAIDGLLKT